MITLLLYIGIPLVIIFCLGLIAPYFSDSYKREWQIKEYVSAFSAQIFFIVVVALIVTEYSVIFDIGLIPSYLQPHEYFRTISLIFFVLTIGYIIVCNKKGKISNISLSRYSVNDSCFGWIYRDKNPNRLAVLLRLWIFIAIADLIAIILLFANTHGKL